VAESDQPRPFDVRTIKFLVRLMSRHDLSEIDLHEGDQRIRLRRGPRTVSAPALPAAAHVPAPAPVIVPTEGPAKPAEQPTRKLTEIKSQVVGTFYAQKEPGAPPYVKIGSHVTPETIVCQIEAMKVFTEVPAGCSGVIEEVLVKDKDFVEYGTVLFRVAPTG
jgi:acetyl-CoA carboxylase biotin carboxyl carrier protein